jgi:seryl-tRNA synthetase
MHDLKALRDNPAHYDAGWARRGLSAQTPAILDIDARLRAAKSKRMDGEAIRNSASKAIGAAKAQKNEAEAARLMEDVARAKVKKARPKKSSRKKNSTRSSTHSPICPTPACHRAMTRRAMWKKSAGAMSATSPSRPKIMWRWAKHWA